MHRSRRAIPRYCALILWALAFVSVGCSLPLPGALLAPDDVASSSQVYPVRHARPVACLTDAQPVTVAAALRRQGAGGGRVVDDPPIPVLSSTNDDRIASALGWRAADGPPVTGPEHAPQTRSSRGPPARIVPII